MAFPSLLHRSPSKACTFLVKRSWPTAPSSSPETPRRSVSDEATWRKVAEAARLSVAKHFSVDVAAKRWASFESELALRSDSFRHALSEGSSTEPGVLSIGRKVRDVVRRGSVRCTIGPAFLDSRPSQNRRNAQVRGTFI